MNKYKIAVKNTLRQKLDKKNNSINRLKLCSTLNISDSTIDRWLSLNDSNTPKTEDLPLICKTLEISLYELFQITIDDDINKILLSYI